MATPAYYATVEDFVKAHEGKHVIEKILIANNGISAVKAIRSIRRWAYDVFGRERAIKFVAMATPDDLKANAEYIRMADEFVEVPGGSNANNYANVNLIISLAKRYNVDAVFAGWGHASENPALPEGLMEEGMIFMGPPSGPMFALGDKIGSTIIAQSAGVPVIPWSGDGLKCDYKNEGNIPESVYRAANITTVEECREAVKRVGLPVMIKASEGGGGKGIRKVLTEDEIDMAFSQVQNEVPGSPIFVMRVAFGARHLEVQLLADHYGNAVALNGRDCSIQRRHQKILEEGPPAAAPFDVWREMEKAAVRLAKEVGYRNAGTVEYLFQEAEKTFCFLELNPRLQVEHPVTEMITGVNLPAAQLQVAMGIPLYRNKDIRRFFGKDPYGSEPIDFDNTPAQPPEGHCIAARITAENPHKNFQPTSGKITELNFRSSRHVWGYFSIDSSGLIHEFADSQLGHVFAWGHNREEARRNLVVALKDLSIRGEIRTTVEYLITLIEVQDYKLNKFHTAWLDERIAKQDVRDDSLKSVTVVLVGAACEAHSRALQREKAYISSLERGQMPLAVLLQQKHNTEIIYDNTKYSLEAARAGLNLYSVGLAGSTESPVLIEVRSLADGGYLVLMGGKSHVAYLKDEVGARRLVIDSQTFLFVDEYDPTIIRAAMGGKIVRALVPDGTMVKKDQAFCEIEVMKMTMPLMVPEDGKIVMLKSGGSVMQPGDVIAKLELADPTKVKKADKFTGVLPVLGDPRPELSESNPHHLLASAQEHLEDVMTGFAPPKAVRKLALKNLGTTSLNPFLFMLEVRETLARVKRGLSFEVQDALLKLCAQFETEILRITDPESRTVNGGLVASMSQVNLAEMAEEPPTALTTVARQESSWKRARSLNDEQLAKALKLEQEYAQKASEVLKGVDSPLLVQVCVRHTQGAFQNALRILETLLDKYSTPEAAFAELEFSDAAEKDDVMQELRRNVSDPKKVYELALSHSAVATKNEVTVTLLNMVESVVRRQEELASVPNTQLESVRPKAISLLKRIASLRGKETTDIALEARQLLIELQHPTYRERLGQIIGRLSKVSQGDADAIDELQHSTDPILHMLIDVLCSEATEPEIRNAALASYVRRVYQTYKIRDLTLVPASSSPLKSEYASWSFYSEPDAVTFQLGGGLGLFGGSDVPAAVYGGSEGENLAVPKTPSDSGSIKEEPHPAPMLSAHNRTPSMSSLGGASSVVAINRPRAGSDQQEEEMVDAGQLMAHAVAPYILRKASLTVFRGGLTELGEKFASVLSTVKSDAAQTIKLEDGRDLTVKNDVQVLHIILKADEPSLVDTNPDALSDKLCAFLRAKDADLKAAGIRRITFAVPSTADQARHHVVAGHGSSFFTFRRRSGWEEDRLVRHIEPSLAYQLDLKRLSNFNIARVPLGKRDLSASRTVHVYRATPKGQPRAGSRLFVRALVRQTSKVDGVTNEADSYPGPERVLVQAIAAIEACQGAIQTDGARNHIFLNVLGEAFVEPSVVERMARHLGRRYASRLATARVGQVELKVNARLDKDSPSIPVRIIASNPTGFGLRVDTYVEAADPSNPGRCVFYCISEGDDGGASGALAAMGLSQGPYLTTPNAGGGGFFGDADGDLEQHSNQAPELHGADTQTPYPISSPLEERRSRALASGTAFCYDFPAIFHKALERSWVGFASGRRGVDIPSPSTMCNFEELVLTDEIDAPGLVKIPGSDLARTTRGPGLNSIAMVAWKATVKTPQYPEGRSFVLIANDITVDAGSFGTREDELFLEASKYARALKIPRLYIAANSGARIGMADEVKRAFKVAWINPETPTVGFRYVYLDADGYRLLGPAGRNSVICQEVNEDGETRFKITAIVGEGRDLGVENLRGSGMIAGETSRAYDETFTLTYVAGRSVGIGAYLVRLGQRTIQKGKDAPIILTGYQALNTLVGSPVYSSNLQLGGPGVMYANGVSHQCVRNDLEGVAAMLQWLSYVPEDRNSALPVTRLLRDDSVEREVLYPISDSDLNGDPRLLLAGLERKVDVNGQTIQEWIPGLFDRGSFQEYMGGWAKTIITGRARLGGIPVGVIIPECRTVVTRIPADPAAPDSQERIVTQAGNVWYPDSSYKTASCIRDVNREGLPLVFIINVRGFSGGQRDMYDAVLKYGSMIVDALVEFKQPVIVYIPRKAELRGGAWVVVDPTINENVMEMWCDETARGGVLEASGAASIKFRAADQIATAHRLDNVLISLDEQLAKLKTATPVDDSAVKVLAEKIKAREKLILPVYSQLATEFADAHDRPGRMVAKGVVHGVVPWAKARTFFSVRLRRLLREFEMAKKVQGARADMSLKEARSMLKEIYEESGEALNYPWNNDSAVQGWMDSPDGLAAVETWVRAEKSGTIAKQVEDLGNQDAAAMLRGLMSLIARMSDEGRLAEREKLVSALRRGVFVLSSTATASTQKPL